MNSDFTDSLLQLERELQSLTPAPPGRDLIRSLQARMEPGVAAARVNKVHAFPWRRMVTPAAAAAAAVAVMSFNNNRRVTGFGGRPGVADHEDATPAIKWTPMPMRSEYRALLDAGLVPDGNGNWVPEYVMNTMNHHEWRNPSENSSMRLIMPASYGGGDTWGAKRRMQFH